MKIFHVQADYLFVIVSSLQPLVRRSADNLGNEKYPGCDLMIRIFATLSRSCDAHLADCP
jgi:hypothetical protein